MSEVVDGAGEKAVTAANQRAAELPAQDWGVEDTIARVRRGDATPREAVEMAIRRIEALDPAINAVVWKRFDDAIAEAACIPASAPLAGLPILLKDAALQDCPFHHGNRVLAEIDWRFPHTDAFTHRLLAAGAIVLGYSNVPEFTSSGTTESQLSGPCRNPWALDRSAGGSSGGAAAAVAEGLVPAAQSSDAGGSTRIPASANGLFTIKTSRGRTPLGPASSAWFDIVNSLSFETRSVRDFAILLDVVAGPDRAETVTAPPAAGAYIDEVGAPPGRLKIGFAVRSGNIDADSHPESVRAAEKAAAMLEELGHFVEEAAPEPLLKENSTALILAYWPAKAALHAARAERIIGRQLGEGDLEPLTLAIVERARSQSAIDYLTCLDRIREFGRRALAWWQAYDLLLTPTTGSPPPPLGLMPRLDPEARAASALWGRFTPFANLTGQPAASVPLHWTDDGLPIGIQLVADYGREDLLLRVASQLEAAFPWHERRPPAAFT